MKYPARNPPNRRPPPIAPREKKDVSPQVTVTPPPTRKPPNRPPPRAQPLPRRIPTSPPPLKSAMKKSFQGSTSAAPRAGKVRIEEDDTPKVGFADVAPVEERKTRFADPPPRNVRSRSPDTLRKVPPSSPTGPSERKSPKGGNKQQGKTKKVGQVGKKKNCYTVEQIRFVTFGDPPLAVYGKRNQHTPKPVNLDSSMNRVNIMNRITASTNTSKKDASRSKSPSSNAKAKIRNVRKDLMGGEYKQHGEVQKRTAESKPSSGAPNLRNTAEESAKTKKRNMESVYFDQTRQKAFENLSEVSGEEAEDANAHRKALLRTKRLSVDCNIDIPDEIVYDLNGKECFFRLAERTLTKDGPKSNRVMEHVWTIEVRWGKVRWIVFRRYKQLHQFWFSCTKAGVHFTTKFPPMQPAKVGLTDGTYLYSRDKKLFRFIKALNDMQDKILPRKLPRRSLIMLLAPLQIGDVQCYPDKPLPFDLSKEL